MEILGIPVFNLLMALIIAIIIGLIAKAKSDRAKNLIYSLPIPITLALIATRKDVEGSHVIGLFLLTGFLWLVCFLRSRGWPILIADVFAALTYATVGYFAVKPVVSGHKVFLVLSLGYALFWIAFMKLYQFKAPDKTAGKGINILAKGGLVFIIALGLLTAKDALQGVVVTFPFSGVFAVVEMRHKLESLAADWTRNSLAVVFFFTAIHFLAVSCGTHIAIALGWVVYFFTLKAIRKYTA